MLDIPKIDLADVYESRPSSPTTSKCLETEDMCTEPIWQVLAKHVPSVTARSDDGGICCAPGRSYISQNAIGVVGNLTG